LWKPIKWLKVKRYKVKWSHYKPCVAHRVGTVIVLLFHDCDTRSGWVIKWLKSQNEDTHTHTHTHTAHLSAGSTLMPFTKQSKQRIIKATKCTELKSFVPLRGFLFSTPRFKILFNTTSDWSSSHTQNFHSNMLLKT
jgi:hypothetical protein